MRWRRILAALALCAVCAGRAAALEYTVEAPENYLFGRPGSVEAVYRETEPVNTDRSKNTARIPPAFGSPTSYLPGSGEYLTPNLVPGALNGGLVSSLTGAAYTDAWYPGVSYGTSASYSGGASYGTSWDSGTVQYPGVETFTWSYEPHSDSTGFYGVSFTDVTDSLYYSGGKIPAIGVNAKIYEGTSNTQLAKGIGHFTDTSIWDGNCCFAAHNRGTNAIFGQIHTMDIGDKITLTTKLGTRTYCVVSVKKIAETDGGDTAGTWENVITLFTCVRNESEYRWCVRAVETSD